MGTFPFLAPSLLTPDPLSGKRDQPGRFTRRILFVWKAAPSPASTAAEAGPAPQGCCGSCPGTRRHGERSTSGVGARCQPHTRVMGPALTTPQCCWWWLRTHSQVLPPQILICTEGSKSREVKRAAVVLHWSPSASCPPTQARCPQNHALIPPKHVSQHQGCRGWGRSRPGGPRASCSAPGPLRCSHGCTPLVNGDPQIPAAVARGGVVGPP